MVDDKTKTLRGAERFVLQGRIPQAIAEYLKIVRSDPSDILTLNTIGDLYLRQGRVEEANKVFAQVAESYVRNNFLLKAIAVYKKILSVDPQNLDINSILASLLAKQGLNVDARNQYMCVADLLARNERKKESLEALEQAVSLDPRDYLSHLKLAESHVEAGNTDRAGDFCVSAAKAQVTVGNAPASRASFKRAIELGSKSPDVLRSYLEACLLAGDVSEILPILNDAVAEDPESVDLLEMKGKAHLANKEHEEAEKAFNAVLSADNSRYENLLLLCHALLELEDFDRASHCLDPIVPIVISRKETDKVTVSLEEILSQRPDHLPTLTKMADILSTTNDQDRHLEVLDRLAVYHLEHQNPGESLEYLLRILQIHPESEKHLDLHCRAHAEAYPGTPYQPPAKASIEKQERTE